MRSIKDYYSYKPSASQSFGAPRSGGARKHRGVDISHSTKAGTPVPALLAGRVISKRSPSSGHGFGYQVTIESTYNGVVEVISYAHGRVASPLQVGQRVAAGAKVLEEGTTGATTGPCVHIERLRKGSYVDPMPLIRAVVANQGNKPAGGSGANGSRNDLLEDDMSRITFVNVAGLSGKRRGGTYMLLRGDDGKWRAQFVSTSDTPGLPTFNTERAIAEAQKLFPGLY